MFSVIRIVWFVICQFHFDELKSKIQTAYLIVIVGNMIENIIGFSVHVQRYEPATGVCND